MGAVVKKFTKDQVINILRKRQGERTAKELADELGVTPQYLSDVYAGRREPGPAILEPLGLKGEMFYWHEPALAEAEGLR